MNKRRALPSVKELQFLFEYKPETGELLWRLRPREMFSTDQAFRTWNTRYAGQPCGCLTEQDGLRITLDGKLWAGHRIIYKMITGLEPTHIDHKNLKNWDNRFDNLRPANVMTNGWNSPGHKNTISGLKGVCFDKNLKYKPWFATVTKNGKSHYGGHFSTKEAAYERACQLRESLHGEFVRHGKD